MSSEKKFESGKVVSVSASHMLHDLFGSFLSPLVPLLRQSAGITLAQVGWLNVAQGFPTIFNPLIGLKTRNRHILGITVVAPSITAIAMSMLGLATNFWSLFILLTVAGISSAFFHVPTPVLIKHASGNKVGRGMSYYMLGGEIARFLGPLTVLGAVELWGLHGTYKLIPLGFIASAMLYWRLHKYHFQDQDTAEGLIGAWAEFRRIIYLMILVGAILLCMSFIRSAMTAFLPSYLVETGKSIWFGGIALAIYQGAGALGTIVSGSMSDRLGRIRILSISVVIAPIVMFFLTLGYSFLLIPMLVLLGLTAFATGPVFLALVQELGSGRPAFMNGLFMTVNFMTSAIAAVGTGWLGDRYGLDFTFRLMPWLALPAIAFVLLMPKAITKVRTR